ncbi:MAG TPA: hypothetical protein VM934_13825 [Pyrinomonadaceae bacterium]|jgi:hypothetical protein|nr:hypothetical protein [Pyrinomonadaceae bacterium]
MSLAEGNELIEVNETDFVDASAAMEHWRQFPASYISHHGTACCSVAREWMLSMDYSELSVGNPLTGPRWLRNKYKWGPSRWPLHWCEAVEQKTLDCGALAALSHEIFTARGVKSFPAQLIHQYSEHAARHWNKGWSDADTSVHWIKEDLIYHEGCAVVAGGNEIKIWDSTATWWINPKQFGGYGGVLALRVFAPQASGAESFEWGTHRIVPNVWQKIERARGDFA